MVTGVFSLIPVRLAVMLCLALVLCPGQAAAGESELEEQLFRRCSSHRAEVGWIAGNAINGYGAILHTIDGGATWTRQGDPSVVPDVDLSGVAAVNGCTAWVVGPNSDGYGTILKTTDGGLTWTRQGDPTQIPDTGLVSVSALDAQTAWVVGGSDGQYGLILKTTDGGATWQRQGQDVAPPVMLNGIYAADRLNVWATGGVSDGYGTILHTSDGGQTWQRQTYTVRPDVTEPYLITCHGLDANTVWVVGRDQALMTTDGGANWQDMTPHGGIGNYDLNGVYVAAADKVWLVTDSDGIYFYNGQGWAQQQPPVYGHYLLRVAGLSADNVWISGSADTWSATRGVVLHTTTGDEPWTAQQRPVDTPLWGISFVRSLPRAR